MNGMVCVSATRLTRIEIGSGTAVNNICTNIWYSKSVNIMLRKRRELHPNATEYEVEEERKRMKNDTKAKPDSSKMMP